MEVMVLVLLFQLKVKKLFILLERIQLKMLLKCRFINR